MRWFISKRRSVAFAATSISEEDVGCLPVQFPVFFFATCSTL